MPEMRIGGAPFSYEVVYSARRTLGVVVSQDGAVAVRAPHGTSDSRIAKFVERFKPWILRQLSRGRKACPARKYVTGESLSYLGKKYRLRVTVDGALKHPDVSLTATRLLVAVQSGLSEETRQRAVKNALAGWYKERAQQVLPERVSQLGRIMCLSPSGIKVKTQLRRWGSCTVKGAVALNWQIVMAPLKVIDYVVIHELCHLKVRHHQKEFWQLVASYSPEFKKLRKWLRLNSRSIAFMSE